MARFTFQCADRKTARNYTVTVTAETEGLARQAVAAHHMLGDLVAVDTSAAPAGEAAAIIEFLQSKKFFRLQRRAVMNGVLIAVFALWLLSLVGVIVVAINIRN